MALCTVSRGYGGRGARGGGVSGANVGPSGARGGSTRARSRAESVVRLPLSPRTLCAPGPVTGPHTGAQAQQHAQQAQSRDHHASQPLTGGAGTGSGLDDGPGSADEPMVHLERPQQAGTWICCVPCYWLRRSKAVHKALLTFAMLLVTSLLVTSPVLFLITTLPEGDQPRDCAPLVSTIYSIIPTNLSLQSFTFRFKLIFIHLEFSKLYAPYEYSYLLFFLWFNLEYS